ncbi:hypothetical protein [Rubinisphaera italica]|uniref:HEAT repeat protein n=1 Tax=Rubinisphaera italica TaxID=2527969 RepID=A0A5C5XF29_9PLAN|nr:hypothetical protein [Rubinisphaera italica]TWT61657.1 hypothetical protein Pan54_23940 [Rubinisphaera italica]
MTTQLDQRVPLPSLCRRRVWLILKPTLLLVALAAAVGIVKWGKAPRWVSETGMERTTSIRATNDASTIQTEHKKGVTKTPGISVRTEHLSVEDRVTGYLSEVHPMFYRFEQEQTAFAIAQLGEEAIPLLATVIEHDLLNGKKLEDLQRHVAFSALGEIGPASVPSLKALQEVDSESHYYYVAANTAIGRMEGDLSFLAGEYDVDWENMSSSVAQSQDFWMLPRIAPTEELLQKYIALLGHADATVRRYTLIALPPFREKLLPHAAVLSRFLNDTTICAEAVIALWATGDAPTRTVLKDKITSWSAAPDFQTKFLTVVSSPFCPGLDQELAARIRVVFDESKNDRIRIAAARILIDADPSWNPSQAELLRLMERVSHHDREGLFYILGKQELTIRKFLNEQRNPSQAVIERARKLLADAESTDSTFRDAAVRTIGAVDSYTHPLYVVLLSESRNSRVYGDWALGRYATGKWLPTWLRLRAYKSLVNQSPKTFYNEGYYSDSHLSDLKTMRPTVLQDCPELLGEYEVLVRFVESQKAERR